MSHRISVVGTGYVGLVCGACFAECGHTVICVDSDERKVASLKASVLPIYEPGLEALVSRNVAAGRLAFTTDLAHAVLSTQAIFICVGTPSDPRTGSADLSAVLAVTDSIAAVAQGSAVIVTKSTVPVGTAARLAARVAARRPDIPVSVASNPEFMREGHAVDDFMHPDRIVVGTQDPQTEALLRDIYAPFTAPGVEMVVTDTRSSELIKFASNTFLATKIAFINEVARLCDAVGADVGRVSHGMGLDRRIGPMFLKPGPGYGGSCFPKDSSAFAYMARAAGSPLSIVDTVLASNQWHIQAMISKIAGTIGQLEGKRVALLGLAFKAQTDDVREAASLTIAAELLRAGATVCAYDPQAMDNARALLPGLICVEGVDALCKEADALVLLTDWPQFAALDLDALAKRMRSALLIDLRNMIDADAARTAGFRLVPLGRPEVLPDVSPVRRGPAERRALPALTKRRARLPSGRPAAGTAAAQAASGRSGS